MNYLIIIIFIVVFILILHYFGNKCENFIVNSRRIIKITAPNKQMFNIKKILETFEKEFNIRNVDIEYVNGLSFKAELYGYDGGLKKTITKMEEIKNFINEIDNMPMGALEKKDRENFYNKDFYNKDRKQLLEKCGLPDIAETSHCFSDSTHHTCQSDYSIN